MFPDAMAQFDKVVEETGGGDAALERWHELTGTEAPPDLVVHMGNVEDGAHVRAGQGVKDRGPYTLLYPFQLEDSKDEARSLEEHWTDSDGNPTRWGELGSRVHDLVAERPRLVGGEDRVEPNGAFVEDVIAAVIGRRRYRPSPPSPPSP